MLRIILCAPPTVAPVALETITPDEQVIFEELTQAGNTVEKIPRGIGKTADFLVNGVTTEVKTLQGSGPNTLKNQIEEAAEQGEHIIVDARKAGVSADYALEQIHRAEGNIGGLAGRVIVLTKDGPVKF